MRAKNIAITLGALICIALIVGGIYLFSRWGYLDVSGDRVMQSDRVSAEVTIYRDDFGVPHIYGETVEDILFASGYAMAEDRLFQLEMTTRTATGRLAEILGPDLISYDTYSRDVGYTRDELQAMLDALPSSDRSAFKALVDGINFYVTEAIADPEAKLPLEFQFSDIPLTTYSETDIFAGVTMVLRTFGASGGRELLNQAFYDSLLERYDAETAQTIFNDVLPLWDPDAYSTSVDAYQAPLNTAIRFTETQSAFLSESGRQSVSGFYGQQNMAERMRVQIGASSGASRSVIIGPEKSLTGNPLMMQATADGLDLHIEGPDFSFAGLNIVPLGIPIMGRGKDSGFLMTTGERDTKDTFFVTTHPDDKYRYLYNGEWLDMEVRTEIIDVKNGAPIEYEVAATVHGTVIARDEENHLAFSQKWAMYGQEAEIWAGALKTLRANTAREQYDLLAEIPSSSSNISFAGSNGDIGFRHLGTLPQRALGVDPRLPTNGDGTLDWVGFESSEFAPSFFNPEKGYVMIWNNNPAPNVQWGDTARYGKHFRTHLPLSLIEHSGKISIDDLAYFNELLGRTFYSTDLNLTSPMFFEAFFQEVIEKTPHAQVKAAIHEMMAWDGLLTDADDDKLYDAPGAPLFLEWRKIALETIFTDDIGRWWSDLDEEGYIPYQTSLLIRALEGEDASLPVEHDYFNGEERWKIVEKSILTTLEKLEAEFGTADMSEWLRPVYWLYLDGNNERSEEEPGFAPRRATPYSGAATYFRYLPRSVVDNGMPGWNMITEMSPDESPSYMSVIPSGGQSWFISTSWKANPHINDQYKLHRDFEFKTVSLDKEVITSSYESRLQILPLDE